MTLAFSIGLALFGGWCLAKAMGKLQQANAIYLAVARERALNEWMISDPQGYLDERAWQQEWSET